MNIFEFDRAVVCLDKIIYALLKSPTPTDNLWGITIHTIDQSGFTTFFDCEESARKIFKELITALREVTK